MAGVNKVILIGNLGADPEMRYLEGGSVIAKFNIATSETYTRNGERITQTEWHRIELWDNLAKVAEQYLKKGDTVYIEGKLRTEEWQDKEGINRTGVRIRGLNMTMLSSRRQDGQDQKPMSQPNTQAAAVPSTKDFGNTSTIIPPTQPLPANFINDGDDDLPF